MLTENFNRTTNHGNRTTGTGLVDGVDDNGTTRYDGQQISTEQIEKVQTEFTSVALADSDS